MKLTIIKQIVPLAVVCSVLLGYQYIGAVWTEPASPGSSDLAGTNADVPIHVGTSTQDKIGGLGVGALTVFGSSQIINTAPRLDFTETDTTTNWSLRADGEEFSLLRVDALGNQVGDYAFHAFADVTTPGDVSFEFDEDVTAGAWLGAREGFRIWDESPEIRFTETDSIYGSGVYQYKVMTNQDDYNVYFNRDFTGPISPANTPLMRLSGSPDQATDYAAFSNEVHAVTYCDEDGNNCTPAGGSFGGIFTETSAGACAHANPFTTACSCPAGFTETLFASSGSNSYQCWR